LLDVLEQRIAEVDGQVNALPTLCFDRAGPMQGADEKAGRRARPAGGMPVPIKDLTNAPRADHPGLAIYRDNVPPSPIFWSSISKTMAG